MATGRNIGNIWELATPLEDNNARWRVWEMNVLCSKPGDGSVRQQSSGLKVTAERAAVGKAVSLETGTLCRGTCFRDEEQHRSSGSNSRNTDLKNRHCSSKH